ncbi:MAG: glycosyl hydrolase [Actinomycetota bacterium]|nr:glycosyl hydrolase [Actinomycetota bacterium]
MSISSSRSGRVRPTQRRALAGLAAVALVATLVGVTLAGRGSPQRTDRTPPPRNVPGEFMLSQREGKIPRNAFEQAVGQAEEIKLATQQGAPGVANKTWRSEGPTNIGGRLTDVAVDPNNEDTIYVAAATGGVWKSTDAGDTFTEAWPIGLTQSIGALAITPGGTLYAGTGESNPGGGSITFGGTGIYVSKDGGKKWKQTGLEGTDRISRIMIDPHDPSTIFVAATGNLFTPGGDRGLYRSTNAGKSWDLVLEGPNGTTGASDIAIDAENPDNVYAVLWDHRREPDLRRYGGEGSGVYRSSDGGDTWTQLAGGLPPSTVDTGRMGIGVSPSDPSRVYVVHIRTNGFFEGFYVSNDGGDSFTKSPDNPLLANSQSSFGWWFGRVWVAPESKDRVFVAGVPLMESVDGGLTWKVGAQDVHVDQHAMAWDEKVDGRIYLGNDGGSFRSDDNGLTWTKGTHEPYTQFYTLDVGEQDPTRIAGGTQDNGSNRTWNGERWNSHFGGDGLENLINYEDQNLVYACFQYGNCARSTDGGDTMTSFTSRTTSTRRNWMAPLEFDPNDPQVMYYGGNILNRSTDAGETWTAISPDLTGGGGRDTQYPFATLTTVAAAKSNGDVLYAGTDDARVWTSKDGGANWERIDEELPDRWVTRVATDPDDEDLAYATFSGFRSGADDAHVFQTTDGGDSWNDIGGNLPNAPVNDIVTTGQTLYVATDVGVFMSRDGGLSWLKLGKDLPLVPVTDLRLHEPSNTMFSSTFGRGIFSIELPASGGSQG